jgi:FtsZ-interacting cell division protein YlmF
MYTLDELYNKLNDMIDYGCTKAEADEFFLDAKESLKEYVTDHIESFFDDTKEETDEISAKNDDGETTEKLERVADVLDEFLRNAEEEEMQGIPYIVYHTPKTLADAQIIADHICDLYTVIVNAEALTVFSFEKLIDFLSGAAYTNGARIVYSNRKTFFVVPYHIEVPDSEIFAYIEEKGVAVRFIDKETAE